MINNLKNIIILFIKCIVKQFHTVSSNSIYYLITVKIRYLFKIKT